MSKLRTDIYLDRINNVEVTVKSDSADLQYLIYKSVFLFVNPERKLLCRLQNLVLAEGTGQDNDHSGCSEYCLPPHILCHFDEPKYWLLELDKMRYNDCILYIFLW